MSKKRCQHFLTPEKMDLADLAKFDKLVEWSTWKWSKYIIIVIIFVFSRNRSPTHSVQYSESSKSDMISERVRLWSFWEGNYTIYGRKKCFFSKNSIFSAWFGSHSDQKIFFNFFRFSPANLYLNFFLLFSSSSFLVSKILSLNTTYKSTFTGNINAQKSTYQGGLGHTEISNWNRWICQSQHEPWS